VPEGLPPAPSSYADLGALQAQLSEGHRAPGLLVLACMARLAPATEDTVSATHRATHQLLGHLQDVLREDRLAESRVVVVTRRAVATHAGEDVLHLARAPLWGLVRAAQTEHPGRLALLDLDASVSAPVRADDHRQRYGTNTMPERDIVQSSARLEPNCPQTMSK